MNKNLIQFEIGQNVKIKEIERNGKIISIHCNRTGITYEVRYFDNADDKSIYFYADELLPV